MVRNRVQKMDHLYCRDIWFHEQNMLLECITVILSLRGSINSQILTNTHIQTSKFTCRPGQSFASAANDYLLLIIFETFVIVFITSYSYCCICLCLYELYTRSSYSMFQSRIGVHKSFESLGTHHNQVGLERSLQF